MHDVPSKSNPVRGAVFCYTQTWFQIEVFPWFERRRFGRHHHRGHCCHRIGSSLHGCITSSLAPCCLVYLIPHRIHTDSYALTDAYTGMRNMLVADSFSCCALKHNSPVMQSCKRLDRVSIFVCFLTKHLTLKQQSFGVQGGCCTASSFKKNQKVSNANQSAAQWLLQ